MGRRHSRSRVFVLVAGLLIPAVVLLVVLGVGQKTHTTNVGPRHTLHLDAPPPFLSDALAVEKAREVLALEGCDPTAWHPREHRRTSAPDGMQDVHLFRYDDYPNTGMVEFESETGTAATTVRIVEIELAGNRLTGRVVFPTR